MRHARSGNAMSCANTRNLNLDKPVTRTNARIDQDRLWESLMDMAKIGPGTAGGNNRQTLTDEDAEGRQLFKSWCDAARLEMGVDDMGSMFARRAGTDPDALPVYIGSHLDTQPTGGKFDGVLGVLGGLEVVRTLNDLGIQTKHPIVITNWTNEEGCRFAPAMVASGVFAGTIDKDWAYAREDAKGKRFGDELERIGWKGTERAGARQMKAYFELHIEQGPILEDEGIDIGVVTHGQGLKWLQVTLIGQEAHSGGTPMYKRRNAALGMARVIELVHEVTMDYQPDAVGNVGHVEVHPNSRSTVPGRTVLTIDIRSPEKEVLDVMDQRIREGIALISEALDIEHEIEQVGAFDPVAFDGHCVQMVRSAAEGLGYSHRDIVSGAGHDACWINRVAPTAMIFCPCADGLSHHEDEDIDPEWAAAGCDVLLHAVLEAAVVVD